MRVLLVEAAMDELLELERAVTELADGWELDVAVGTEGALAVLGAAPFDAIVSSLEDDVLLQECRRRHPEIARFALSAETEPVGILWKLRDAQQILSAPCRPDRLVAALQRLERALPDVAGDERATLGAIDSLAAVGGPLATLLRDPGAGLGAVSELVGRDPGLAAKVLQIANTAFFSRCTPVVDIATAVQRIGLDALRSALECGLFASTRRPERVSVAVANVAASLVPDWLGAEAFTAALLCDVRCVPACRLGTAREPRRCRRGPAALGSLLVRGVPGRWRSRGGPAGGSRAGFCGSERNAGAGCVTEIKIQAIRDGYVPSM